MSDCAQKVAKGETPSPECLALAAHHISHDLELFQHAWAERHTRLGWTLWFVLARSLIDFFFKFTRKKRDGEFLDDILAADFPTNEDWRTFAEPLLKTAAQIPEWKPLRDAANKNAAHLTYTRVDGAGTEPSEPIHRLLTGVAAAWRDRLTPEARVWLG